MSIDILKFVNSYEFDFTLPGTNEVIMFKPITTGQLKKLVIYENETNAEIIETVLDSIISECVISEEFNISNLYLEDRFALLVELRKKSKGDDYNFTYKCPECGSLTPVVLNLNDLEIKKKELNTEPFKISDDLSFDIDFITRGEQTIINNTIKKLNIENTSLEQIEKATYSYAMSMKKFHTPDGDTDVSLKDRINLLDNVLTEDQYKEYVKWFEDNEFGIKFEFEFSCNNCDKKDNFIIPLNNFFV